MENKIYANPKYKCGICGEVYDEIKDRVKCETACLKKQAEEAKKAELEKKRLEQTARKAELDAAIERAAKLNDAYIKDYGSYEYISATKSDDFMPFNVWKDMFFF